MSVFRAIIVAFYQGSTALVQSAIGALAITIKQLLTCCGADLEKRMHRVEHEALVKAVRGFVSGEL